VVGLSILTGAGFAALPVIAADPLPYSLAVQVHYADPAEAGPAILLEELEIAIIDTLRAQRCFQVLPPMPDARDSSSKRDLVLEVTLSSVLDETRSELSLADRAAPGGSGRELMGVAVFSVDVEAEVLVMPMGVGVRSKRFHLEAQHQPRMSGEDSREEARRAVELQVARKVASMACKLSPKRVEQLRTEGAARAMTCDSPVGH